jgi:hypothetical protein
MPQFLMNLIYRSVASICIVLLVPMFMLLHVLDTLLKNNTSLNYLESDSFIMFVPSLKWSYVPFCVIQYTEIIHPN